MNKSTIIALIALLLVGGGAIALKVGNKPSTLKVPDNAFALSDTSQVGTIEISPKGGEKIVLERNGDKWMLRGFGEANLSNVEVLLDALVRQRIKEPVPKAGRSGVIADLAAGGTLIEVKDRKGNELKKFFVGNPTPDELGTLMLREGDDDPFVVHVPGFNGYLSPRYNARASVWQSTRLFPFSSVDISEVRVEYPHAKDASFTLSIGDNETYRLLEDKPLIVPALKAKRLLAGFGKQYAQSIMILKGGEQDSILKLEPFARLEVKWKGMIPSTSTPNASSYNLDLYPYGTSDRTKGETPTGADIDLYIAHPPQTKVFYLVQARNLARVLASKKDLLP